MRIESLLNRWGRSIFIKGADGWESPLFNAFIQPLRYKNKLYLYGDYTPIGINKNDLYLYIGPPSRDLSKLDSTYRLYDGEFLYLIDRAEKVYLGNTPQYVWAVIRKTTEEANGI